MFRKEPRSRSFVPTHLALLLTLVSTLFSVSGVWPLAYAAQIPAYVPRVQNRLTQPVDDRATVMLKGTVHPLANAANDKGAVSDDMELNRMQLVLKRSPEQEEALKHLIGDLHTPGSASYHQWLTPEEFGKSFGPSDADVAVIQGWLQSRGFSSVKLNPGRQTIEFAGSAGLFRSAFHTGIHRFTVNGETRYANVEDPQIPAALAPVVGNFASLNNFRPRPAHSQPKAATYNPHPAQGQPMWQEEYGDQLLELVSPGDFAVQYDLNPVYRNGTTGSGQTIAILGASNIDLDYVNRYRAMFGLPANPPQIIIDGNDPGIAAQNNPDGPQAETDIEAYLDVELAGAVAPNATIDLVIAADTAVQSGLYLAAERAVYANIAPVISLSYGQCEPQMGALNTFFSTLWEQAAAQGITVMVSAGDSGAAGCDNENTQNYAVGGHTVSGFASTPFNIAVGGTDFFYTDYASPIGNGSGGVVSLSNYWSYGNGNANFAPGPNLVQRVPEQPWNDALGMNILGDHLDIVGGGGGASTAGVYDPSTGESSPYPKPAWQAGTGVPNDQVRDIPDVSLFASSISNISAYPICAQPGDCVNPGLNPLGYPQATPVTVIGGTSASSPSFAAIMSLVNQQYGRQGQANYVLYPLATQYPATFHDITIGSNSVPCNLTSVASSLDGSIHQPTDCIADNGGSGIDPTYGPSLIGQTGDTVNNVTTIDYTAHAGYDLATGLGSVDVTQLLGNWSKIQAGSTPTTTTLTPSSTSFAHGTPVTVSGYVLGLQGPTGDVGVFATGGSLFASAQGSFPLTGGGFAPGFLGTLSTLPGGTYSLYASYPGDAANLASTSGLTQVTVTPETSALSLIVSAPGNNTNPASAPLALANNSVLPFGTQISLAGTPVPAAYYNLCLATSTPPANCAAANFGPATGAVTFYDNGTPIDTASLNIAGQSEFNAPLSIGSHSITASYAGDSSYGPSTAPALHLTIAQNTPTLTFWSSQQTSGTGSASSPLHILEQSQVTNLGVALGDSANRQYAFAPVAPPTGSITITGLPSGPLTCLPPACTLAPSLSEDTNGSPQAAALFQPVVDPAPGPYTLTVSYSGDANYAPVTNTYSVVFDPAPSGQFATGFVVQAVDSSDTPFTGPPTPTRSLFVVAETVPTNNVIVDYGNGSQPQHATGHVYLYDSVNNLIGATELDAVGDAQFYLPSTVLLPGVNLLTVQYAGDGLDLPASQTLTVNNTGTPGASTFSLSGAQVAVANPGDSGSVDVQVLPQGGFTGTVTLSCAVSQGVAGVVSGISCPGTASVTGNGVGTLAFNTSQTTLPGTYTLVVTGVSGTNTQVTNVTLTVGGSPEVLLSSTAAQPASIQQLNSATSTFTITPGGGFLGPVGLSCSVSPANLTGTPTCSYGLATVNVVGTSPVTGTLTFTTLGSTYPGTYTVTLTASYVNGGGTTSTVQTAVPVTVTAPLPSFSLGNTAFAPTSIAQGSFANASVSVTSQTAYTGEVGLTCNVIPGNLAGAPACTLTPASVTLQQGQTVASTLNVTTSAATVPGTYTVNIVGSDGTLSGETTLPLTVTGVVVPAFSLSATTPSAVAQGSSVSSALSIVPSGGFSGNVNLTCTVAPGNLTDTPTCSVVPSVNVTGQSTLTLALAADAKATAGSYTVTVNGTSGSLSSSTSFPLTVIAGSNLNPGSFTLVGSSPAPIVPGNAVSAVLTVTPTGGFTGNVTLTCSVVPSTQAGTPTCSVLSPLVISGTDPVVATLIVQTQANTGTGSYQVTVNAVSGTVSATTTVQTVVTPGLALTAGAAMTVAPGSATSSSVTVTPGAGFTGSVALTCSVAPSNQAGTPTCTVLTPLNLTGTAPVTANLIVNTQTNTTPGAYTVTVNASSGSLAATTTLPLTVSSTTTGAASGFVVSASTPSPATISAGATSTSTLTLTPSGGFTGLVAMTCSVSGGSVSAILPLCSVGAPVAITGTTAVTATLNISTVAKTTTAKMEWPTGTSWKVAEAGVTLASLLLFGLPRRRRNWRKLLGLLVFAVIAGSAMGCAGGDSPKVTTNPNATTPGSYTVLVLAVSPGATTTFTSVQITVQ